MARLHATIGVILFWVSSIVLAAKTDHCDFYAAIGQTLNLPFKYDGLTLMHVLRWTHNNSIIFYREQGRVSVGKTGDISSTGSLILRNLQPSSAGSYQANVLHPNHTSATTWTRHVCIMDRVSKPKLTFSCDFKSSAVKLSCEVAKAQGLAFSWTLDEKTLTSETQQTLSISLAQLKGERSFTCSVENKVSKERSDVIRPTCKAPSPPTPPSLLCFKANIVVGVAATGAAVILILLITVILLCCRRKHSKTRMTSGDGGQLRMLSLNKREPDSVGPVYETMQPAGNTPPPTPETSVRVCYEKVSQPEAPTENRPSELSVDAEGQKNSPVPKPRTRAPQTQNI